MSTLNGITAPTPTARFLGGLVIRPIPAAMRPARTEFSDLLTTACPLLDQADSILMFSELITNAARHAMVRTRGRWLIRVRCWRDDDALRVEVHDPGSARPTPSNGDLDACDGRGLLLVDALSSEWGSGRGEWGGTMVWFAVKGVWGTY